MVKKRKLNASAVMAMPVADLAGSVVENPRVESPAGAVVLLVDRLDAHRQRCLAGTVISPNVEGWPAHRVQLHVQHGYAQQQETV
mgnify:CR=1 FL=1